MDISLDLNQSSPTYMDLLLDPSGDLVLTQDADPSGANPALQGVLMALRSYRGEWFLDLGDGIPYYQHIFIKGTSLSDVQTIFHDAILDVPGIVQLSSLQVSLNAATRDLSVRFSAQTSSGDVSYSGRLEYATGSDTATGAAST